jgi:hypothetical protein
MKRILIVVIGLGIFAIYWYNTYWWGRPLDPKEFWKGKVIWLSREARAEAHKHSRGYPPMPYDDPTIPEYHDTTDVHVNWGIDIPYFKYRATSREAAFWDKFQKTHPIPPEEINSQQLDVASSIVSSQPSAPANQKPDPGAEIIRNHPLQFGYPPEAFTPEALFWTYVMDERRQYEKLANSGLPKKDIFIKPFLLRLKVDTQYITQPLSAEQMQAANAWKIAYLDRLQQQNTDPSYINAYLQAWHLSTNSLSGGKPR